MKWKSKLFSIIALVSIVGMMFASPVLADEGEKNKPSKHPPVGVGQEVQIDKHTKVKLKEKHYDNKGKLESLTYEATIDLIPQTLENGNPIDTRWYEKTDKAGYTYYETGANLFTAKATPEGRVSVTDEQGRVRAWHPTLTLDTVELKPVGDPTILERDAINENYNFNVIEWVYKYQTGNFFTRNTITIRRQVRIIEGSLMEFYIFDGNPNANFGVHWGSQEETNSGGKLSGAVGFDSSPRPQYLDIFNGTQGFAINKTEFDNKAYPVIIDPTSSFTTSSYDGELSEADTVYLTARNSATGFIRQSTVGVVGQWYGGAGYDYDVLRFMVFFDTSSLPDNAVIDSGYVQLYGYGGSPPSNNFYVTIQSGMPTYPHAPPVTGDYSYVNYSGNGGQLYTSTWTTSGYNYVYLSATGKSWINKTGTTKFLLRSSDDINSSAPGSSQYNTVTIREYSYGTGYAPKLSVTYSIPITTPTVSTTTAYNIGETSAYLRGYLSDDGGEANVVKFQYGTTIAYGSESYTQSGVYDGEYFDAQITGLSRGTLYHYRAVATNSAGTSYGLDKTFTTLPAAPTGFSATAGNQQNVLNWTKGTGATNTMVRFKTTGYPSSISDGTQIYNSTLQTYTHTPLTGGTTYYYSAWSETSGQYSTTYATTYGTPYVLAAPTLTTNDATGVGVGDADLNGYLNALNQVGGTVTLSFEWDVDSGAPYANSAAAGTLGAPGSFTVNIAGLNPATPYFYRAKGVGTNGTGYGSEKTFTTSGLSAPTMDTTAATGVGLTYATLNGKVLADGGASVTVWFVWGLSADNLNNTTATYTGLVTNDTFYINLSGLSADTTYYYQAVGQNSEGTGYGDVVNFTTSAPSAPTVVTNSASEVGAITATLSGTLTSDGGVPCEVQFEWDTDSGAPYASSTGWQTGYQTGQTFTAVISGLAVDTPYYFRASAKNADSTVYGSEVTFTTVFEEPSDFTAKTIGAATISLSWTNQGDQTYIIYKTTGYPVDRLDGTQVYFGSSTSATHSNLSAGTTYFYRAWSWRTGDVWSGDYAEDAATTSAIMTSGDTADTGVLPSGSGTDDELYQDPDPSGLVNMPFYDLFDQMLDDVPGQPSKGMFWAFAGMLISLMIGFAAWRWTQSVLVGMGVSIGLMYACSEIGILPSWIMVVYLITAIGIWALFGLKGSKEGA